MLFYDSYMSSFNMTESPKKESKSSDKPIICSACVKCIDKSRHICFNMDGLKHGIKICEKCYDGESLTLLCDELNSTSITGMCCL